MRRRTGPRGSPRFRSSTSVDGQGHVYRLSSSNGPGTTLALMEAAAAANVVVHSLSVQSTTLDDVFVHYTGHELRDRVAGSVGNGLAVHAAQRRGR